MSVTPSESQGDEMTKTVELLANVEAVIVELENKNSSGSVLVFNMLKWGYFILETMKRYTARTAKLSHA